jgi:hypothetical protein
VLPQRHGASVWRDDAGAARCGLAHPGLRQARDAAIVIFGERDSRWRLARGRSSPRSGGGRGGRGRANGSGRVRGRGRLKWP